jgi:hypothetical protein
VHHVFFLTNFGFERNIPDNLVLGLALPSASPYTIVMVGMPSSAWPMRMGVIELNRITAALALAAGMSCLLAGQADAQKYYARERLVGLNASVPATPPVETTYTYEATKSSSTFGACLGGFKSAPVTECTRSDGAVVANSFCTPKPVVCGTCRTLASSQWIGSGGTAWDRGSAASADAAQIWCNAKKPADFVGNCFWDSRDKSVVVTTSPKVFFNNPALYGSACY